MNINHKLKLGRELFLEQLGSLKYYHDPEVDRRSVAELEVDFEVDKELSGAFWIYQQEYIGRHGRPVKENGPFHDDSRDMHHSVYEKLWQFYIPLVNRLEAKFQGLRFRIMIETNPYDVCHIVVYATNKDVGKRVVPVPFIVWWQGVHAWVSFFGDDGAIENPASVYLELAEIYLDMLTRVEKALMIFEAFENTGKLAA